MHSMSLGNFIKILSVLGYKLDIIKKGEWLWMIKN
jgi:hypothetical protein